MAFASGVSAEGIMAGASLLSRPAEEYTNDARLEEMWAGKCFEYAEIHFNLLCSVDPKILQLTAQDDRIYESFLAKFPDFRLDIVKEECLKSPAAKQKWRRFCEEMKDIDEYSFGTLLRLDCTDRDAIIFCGIDTLIAVTHRTSAHDVLDLTVIPIGNIECLRKLQIEL